MSEFFKRQKTWISSAHQGFVREGMHSNTLPAYALAAEKGADMIETDARMTRDGVLIVHHDPDVKGFDAAGNPVTCLISETDFAEFWKKSASSGAIRGRGRGFPPWKKPCVWRISRACA